jgi:hypothetical protein
MYITEVEIGDPIVITDLGISFLDQPYLRGQVGKVINLDYKERYVILEFERPNGRPIKVKASPDFIVKASKNEKDLGSLLNNKLDALAASIDTLNKTIINLERKLNGK